MACGRGAVGGCNRRGLCRGQSGACGRPGGYGAGACSAPRAAVGAAACRFAPCGRHRTGRDPAAYRFTARDRRRTGGCPATRPLGARDCWRARGDAVRPCRPRAAILR